MSFDVVLVTDTGTFPTFSRGYGSHRLASHLRQNGYTVLVVDFSSLLTFSLWEEICEYSIGDNTKLVGFSTTWWPYRTPFKKDEHSRLSNIDWGAETGNNPNFNKDSLTYSVVVGEAGKWVDLVKSKNRKTKIIVGGPKIDFYLDFPADHFINGLGENQVLDLLTESRRIWPRVIQHDINSNARNWGWNHSTTIYTELDQIQKNEILTLEISRGCKFKCNFCSFPLIGQKEIASYLKTEDTIYNELLKNYESWGTTKYFIADDTFNDSIEKLEMMVRIKNKLPFDFKFKAYIRADVIATQPKQIELLKDSGLASCYIGIESFHPEASKFAGKGMDPSRRKQSLYDMNAHWGDSVSINVGYIVGLPGEDEKFLREEAEWFSQKDCPANYGVSFLGLQINPVQPGKYQYPSEIDKNPESFGYTIPDMSKPNHWIKNDGTDITTYKRAAELADELNEYVWNKHGKRIDNIDYKKGTVNDPLIEYFSPLIKMLKNV